MKLHEAVSFMIDSSIYMKKNGKNYNIFYIVDLPGAGKTSMIMEECKKRGYGFLSFSPALERYERFGGIPEIFKDGTDLRTEWSIPEFIYKINDESKKFKDSYVFVLLDDWHLANEDIQAIGFELFTYYKLNDKKINNNVIFCLAGNFSTEAGMKIPLSAITNRLNVLKTKADLDYWIRHYADKHINYDLGVSFLKYHENYFQEKESPEPFGSPRSWTSVFNLFKFMEDSKHPSIMAYDEDMNAVVSEDAMRDILLGHVSEKASADFMLFYNNYKSFNMEKIFLTGEFTIPGNNLKKFCFISGATDYILREYKDVTKNIDIIKKEDIYKYEVFMKIVETMWKDNPEITLGVVSGILNREFGKDMLYLCRRNGIFSDKFLKEIGQKNSVINKFLSK